MKSPSPGRAIASIAIAAVSLSLIGCSTETSNESGDGNSEISIGLLADFTGPASLFGEPAQLAAELAVSEINESGGVNGSNVNLVVGDEASDPSTGVSVVSRFIQQDEIVALFGEHNSATRDAVQPVAEADDIPYFYNAVNEGGVCATNLVVTGEVPSQQLSQSIPWVQEEAAANKWFLLGNDYVWPQTTFVAAKEYIKAAGGSVVGEEYVPLGTTDFQSIISKIRASGANVMIPALVGSDAVAFEKQAYDAGLGNEAVQRLGVLYEDNTRAAFGPEVAAGMFNAVGYDQAIQTEANKEFLAAYYEAFGKDAPPQTTVSVQTYVAIKAWAQAANDAESVEMDSMFNKLIGMSIDAPAGKVTFEKNRFMAQPIVITENMPDGKASIVKSFESVQASEECSL